MNLEHMNIDWNSPDALMQVVKNIQEPLSSIIEASHHFSGPGTPSTSSTSSRIIFSNSQEIKRLIDEVVKRIGDEQNAIKEPLIFKIYLSNERVQSMCCSQLNPKTISKQDMSWLKMMEEHVYKRIKHKDLNLYDLAFEMSVSERQLHRKIKNLVHLTPNKYIRVLKLHRAKELIDGYLYDTISQIAYAVGYYDTHYFSKLFNQQYGITPKQLINTRSL